MTKMRGGAANAPDQIFTLIPQPNVQPTGFPNSTEYQRLIVRGDKTGFFSIEFMMPVNGAGLMFELPSNAPLPKYDIVTQSFDGKRFWIDAGTREIKAGSLRRNRKYRLEFSGIFQ